MEEKLYKRMNWPRIEALAYSEEDKPREILGPHRETGGVLIQAFQPTAAQITVVLRDSGQEYGMELADESGFFAALLPGRKIPDYFFRVTYDDGSVQEMEDPYRFAPKVFSEKDLEAFAAGIHYTIYEKLGAHPMTLEGTKGYYFAVWAPNAARVSVVGDFNLWDGRRHPMQRLEEAGIFELFIPGLEAGSCYKYEVKTRSGLPMLKADPYANAAQLRPDNASVMADLSDFHWTDAAWMADRAQTDYRKKPLLIYELHLGSWKKPEGYGDGDAAAAQGNAAAGEFCNYRELAHDLAAYVKDMGYTHVELLPVMEHPLDESLGYQTTGYYAPSARYGTPQDFQYFVDYLHAQGIGVILDWVPAHFPKDEFGLAGFDGTCLYEHLDPRKGSNPKLGTLLYNYGRPQVKNFLIANALFWAEVYHADGIRMDSVASMLYLDYGKAPGEWEPNLYGGNENLEAVEFLKHLNSIFKKRKDGALLIAEESSAWPKVTAPVEEDGLGFDFKWNTGWVGDFLGYMHYDPVFRGWHHGELTGTLLYAYSEEYILSLSHDLAMQNGGALAFGMPGDQDSRLSNLRAAYGFWMTHPGKKLLFMGQDFASFDEWSVKEGLDWDLLRYPDHGQMRDYVKALNHLCLAHPALYEADDNPDGFTWINSISANENMLVFTRQAKEEILLVVCNFSPLVYEKHKIGVPFEGRYKEIFNSDSAAFGGTDARNRRVKQSKKSECDAREDSIEITVPPMGIAVFSCTPEQAEEKKAAVPKKSRKAAAGKAAAKKTPSRRSGGKAAEKGSSKTA